jgi:hypothetical protein
MENDVIFKKVKDRNVKDLYWLLFSKCPINNDHPELEQIPFFPNDILEDWELNGNDYFLELDQRPNDLHQFLKRPKNKRLGFYAEALLSFFFQTFPEVELLLQNYQIIENKKTLGEIDFVIKWKKRVLHIECAVKFYLCVHSKDINDLHNWIGPACKDDLGRKIRKVKDHQLPMIDSPIFKDVLNCNEIESFLFLKGKLYVNKNVRCDWVNNELLGKYYYSNDIGEQDRDSLKLLIKPFWMSIHSEIKLGKNVSDFNRNTLLNRAELIMKSEMQPFFIAPEGWPF